MTGPIRTRIAATLLTASLPLGILASANANTDILLCSRTDSEHSNLPGAKNESSKQLKNKSKDQDDDELAPKPAGINMDELEKSLKGEGLTGEIHAADPANRQYVFTYRDPKDFFNNVQIGMLSHKKDVLEFFQSMKRHDRVMIKGELFHTGEFFPPSPQPHIEVKSIQMVKSYDAPVKASDKFQKATPLPDELKGLNEANFLVHAVLKNGAFLVLEYKDNFVFVVVPDPKLCENLYRNDRIHMRYKVQNFPEKPTHLEVDPDTSNGKQPITVLDSIHVLHKKSLTQEGNLVRFPKSPQINRDIWAVEQKSSDGNSRTFTLVNFVKEGEQDKIDAKLKGWWDQCPDKIIDGRNKLYKPSLRIKAKGIMNVIDQNQANAQMKLTANDLQLVK